MGQRSCATTLGERGSTIHHDICAWLMLTAISAIVKGMSSFPFAAVGLHFQNNGWVLWHLGAANLVAFISRTLTHSLIAKFGSWSAAPVSVLRTLLLVPSMIFADSEAAVILALVGYWVLEPELGLQGLCHNHFKGDAFALMRASRIQSLSSTLGYAFSPLMCGLAFDFGGWQLVSLCGFGLQAISTLMLCFSPLVHKDWRARRQDSAGTHANGLESDSGGKEGRSLSSLPRALLLPGLMTALGNFANLYSYHTEWVTFAVYFRDEHNWTNSAMAAFFQMFGDVIGAIVLLAAMRKSNKKRQWFPRTLTRASGQPFNISWLLGAWALLNFGMTAPSLYVAVAAQIAMGTVYVLFVQYVNEMNMALAAGDPTSYLILQLMCSIFYSTACSISGTVSLAFYESVGPLVPFYVSTGVSLCCALAHAIYFILKGMPSAAHTVTDSLPDVARRAQKEDVHGAQALAYTHVPSHTSDASSYTPTSGQGQARTRWNHILNEIKKESEMYDELELGNMPVWVDSTARFRDEIAKVADAILKHEAPSSEGFGAKKRPRTKRRDRRYHTIDVAKIALERVLECDHDLSPVQEPDMEPEVYFPTFAKTQSHQPTVTRSLSYQPDTNQPSVGRSQPHEVRMIAGTLKSRKSMPSELLRPWSSRVWRDLEMEKPADVLTRERFRGMISEIPGLNMAEDAIDLIFDTLDVEQSGNIPLKSFTDLIASLIPRSSSFALKEEANDVGADCEDMTRSLDMPVDNPKTPKDSDSEDPDSDEAGLQVMTMHSVRPFMIGRSLEKLAGSATETEAACQLGGSTDEQSCGRPMELNL